MILNLQDSKFFQDPDPRFAKEHALPLGTWKELWRRYKLLDYSNGDLRDYLFVKFARNLSYNSMERWIVRSEVYVIARPVLERGAIAVNSNIFGIYEQFVLDEVTKNLRFSGSIDSKIII